MHISIGMYFHECKKFDRIVVHIIQSFFWVDIRETVKEYLFFFFFFLTICLLWFELYRSFWIKPVILIYICFQQSKGHLCLRRVFSLITKLWSEIIWFCIVCTINGCSMHENLHYHVRSPLVYVKQATTSTLLLALVATIFTPNNVKLFLYL